MLLPPDGFQDGGWSFPPIEVADPRRPRPSSRLRPAVKAFKRLLRRGVGGQGAGAQLGSLLGEQPAVGSWPRRALIVGGATVGDGARVLYDTADVEVIAFDIYPTAATTFVADGHRIPLADGSVDAVWIQAVLEHVYRPADVVSEIVRVLRPGGLLYAETPFLQPVHEGAFDYMRFNLSGHRLLFAAFDEIDSGPLGGPGAVLNLALRGVVGGLSRSRQLARLAYVLTQPLVLLDRLVPMSWRVDFATGNYFLGRLRSPGSVPAFDAVGEYRGAG